MIFREVAHRASRFGIPRIASKQTRCPRCGMDRGEQHLNESGFSRAIRAEQAKLDASRYLQRKIRYGSDLPAAKTRAVGFAQTRRLDSEFRCHAFLGYELKDLGVPPCPFFGFGTPAPRASYHPYFVCDPVTSSLTF